MTAALRVGISAAANGTSDPYPTGNLDRMINEALREAGRGAGVEGPALAGVIEPGMSVLVKPNWVMHRNESGLGMDCMITHPEFVLAALRHVSACRPSRIVLGDAPIQGCEMDSIVTDEFKNSVVKACGNIDVRIADFRRTVVQGGDMVSGVRRDTARQDFLLFDLGPDSLLEPISSPPGRFRVTMYDPRELAKAHGPGRHQYLIRREAVDSDVVLSLPKLKAHRKAGITGALKNVVGVNGSKEYLPHHRVGGTRFKGDCYPGAKPLKRIAEFWLDMANRNIGRPRYEFYNNLSKTFLRSNAKRLDGDDNIEGSWHGNDTVWRMILDINRILLYGRSDGTMADEPQRRVLSLTDAIVCGQGDGPLAPTPAYVGCVTFSESAAAADYAHCGLLRFDPQKLPAVREAFNRFRWPLVDQGSSVALMVGGKEISLAELAATLGVDAAPPAAWVGHIELEGICGAPR